jgi:hypothetical protein
MANTVTGRVPKRSGGKFAATFRMDFPELDELIKDRGVDRYITERGKEVTADELRKLFAKVIVPAYKRVAPRNNTPNLLTDKLLRNSIRSVALNNGLEREISMDWRLGLTIRGRGPTPKGVFPLLLSGGQVVWMHRSPETGGRATTRSHVRFESKIVRLPGGGKAEIEVPKVESIDARFRTEWPLRAYYSVRDGGYLQQAAINIGIRVLEEYVNTWASAKLPLGPTEYQEIQDKLDKVAPKYMKMRKIPRNRPGPKHLQDAAKLKQAQQLHALRRRMKMYERRVNSREYMKGEQRSNYRRRYERTRREYELLNSLYD